MLAGLSLIGTPAAAQVSVQFIAPEGYTDAGNRANSNTTLRVTLAEIRRLFVELGNRVLSPGESLSIQVLDIDLAGFDPPTALPNVPRVVTDVSPPRIRLRYALRRGSRTVLSGEDRLSDANFLARHASVASSAAFNYERALIQSWLRTRVASR